MSNWKDFNEVEITTEFAFPAVEEGSKSSILCQNGEIATWEYDSTDDDGDKINIYDSSSGEDIKIAFAYVLPGRDLFMGLFSTGAIPSLRITDTNCKYFRIDY